MSRDERRALGPEAEELDFLERSLADLDAERAAGDISEDDYRQLTATYAERADAVRRRGGVGGSAGGGDGNRASGGDGAAGGGRGDAPGRIHRGGGRGPGPVRRRRQWRRPVAVLVVVAMVGGGLGIGLASALGSRSSLDTATGDIRQSTRGMLFEAQEHLAAGRFEEAEQIYAAVVDTQPSNAEAHAYWGWIDFQRGDLDSAGERIATAVAADARYPPARVFGAVVALRTDRFEEAAAHLAVFDAVDPPPLMLELVADAELRERVLAGRLAAAEATGDAAAVESLLADATSAHMATAAHLLADRGQPVLAARLFGRAVEADPANVAALVGRGALLTSPDFAAFEDLLAEGMRALDRAVELAPDDPEARFWRGLALARLGLFGDALADLDHLAALPAPARLLSEGARLAEQVRAAAATSR
ncbi:MAG: tetratricopeptide repeat protein [Acidimicrobiia bacterium]|nr:tetratricopeptide repeat protein [Acidimicrobiia bacterium]